MPKTEGERTSELNELLAKHDIFRPENEYLQELEDNVTNSARRAEACGRKCCTGDYERALDRFNAEYRRQKGAASDPEKITNKVEKRKVYKINCSRNTDLKSLGLYSCTAQIIYPDGDYIYVVYDDCGRVKESFDKNGNKRDELDDYYREDGE